MVIEGRGRVQSRNDRGWTKKHVKGGQYDEEDSGFVVISRSVCGFMSRYR